MGDKQEFRSFSEFYPFYLSEHSDRICRRLHYIGSLLVIAILLLALFSHHYMLLLALPVVGYGFAWVGHFFFEHNRPATFRYPAYSFLGDWVMLKDMLTGRIRF